MVVDLNKYDIEILNMALFLYIGFTENQSKKPDFKKDKKTLKQKAIYAFNLSKRIKGLKDEN